ncbi:MAG: 50S ribosomal protein L5 [Microgenomates group bacterium GW2011_GWC1_38_14]|nr:MAG: 50S ribosomal protein L5 [Candidatus Levybacteria bacterium GW2011_GWA2_36_13]KKQ00801.1 MAG: 50S ribosomal protein L5 [Candidatus Levybacteria bacterium GW2011_GWB1_36_18]KKQ58306.1 MAG: 50S ribosomal protein L5 [Microgenomates group bacterium GW2011_GWC1_38_14]KKR15899.1 MAG: 50S ribosomal protein L5 [Candidatus Levybacteria bacterium GW2011_GWA1_39_32]OGH43841.1 MAG: 50S ribosomal protein L5 [Candidatus Levybacteria bacterium RIFCSPLOWO2_02_FULL_37_11]
MENISQRYQKTSSADLAKELDIKNVFDIPRISKIVLNMGVKDALSDKKNIEKAIEVLGQITGQKPKITKAKKAISTFKLREGDEIGLMVTLRGKRMYDFFQKLVGVVLPRLRDFHGVPTKSFDGRGNYSLGFAESLVFPEIDPGKIDKIQGLEITIVTTAKDDKEGFALLKSLGMPFSK